MNCPRCSKGADYLQRDSLFNSSPFLRKEERGKRRKATKIRVYCTFCGYSWRSVSKGIEKLPEKSTDKENSNGT